MDSQTLLTPSAELQFRPRRERPLGRLHEISDSALHIGLLLALAALVILAVLQGATQSVAVWQLETVVVQGQASR